MKIVFDQAEDFAACRAAEKWCKARSIAVGFMHGYQPRGLIVGDVDIAKWRNLTAEERAELDGAMSGDMRRGPVTVTLTEAAYARCHLRTSRCEHGIATLEICERCDR